jgi:hypothetical protein
MSVLDDFARMRLYRNRAAEFEELGAIIESWQIAKSEPTKLAVEVEASGSSRIANSQTNQPK